MLLGIMIAAGWMGSVSGQESFDKTVYKYKVSLKGKKVGWASAVVKTSDEVTWLHIHSKVKTRFAGIDVKMSSKTAVKYDASWRALYFDIQHVNPSADLRVVGKRSGKGYDITRTKDGKTEKSRVEDDAYDRVSVEPALYSDPAGSVSKLRILFAGQGKVGKATVSVFSRKKETFFGRDVTVIHYRIKGGFGSVDEWRLENGAPKKSEIQTPVGKLFIEPQAKE
jgi:hypothetical protein